MNRYKDKAYTLKWLTAITAAVLVGIIALQVYWLSASYTEQKSRFAADVKNAIFATVFTVQMNKTRHNAPGNAPDSVNARDLSDAMAKALSKLSKEALNKQPNAQQTVTISVTNADVHGMVDVEKAAGKQINILPGADNRYTTGDPKKELELYKGALKQELNKTGIKAPFELALIDSSQHILVASCDTQAFRNIKIKSSTADFANQMTMGDYNLQAAFPDANLYMVRRMAWVLVVTCLLIVIGSCSLSYLLILFFQQKKLADIRNDFMNNMTHELKTPISSVAVALEMVLDERHPMDDHKKTQYLTVAQGELKRLNMLVENVLKIASFERSEIKIAKEPVEIHSWLLDIEVGMQPLLIRKGAVLTKNINPETLTISADKTHLTNVMQNLIENALKYNDKEVPRISIDIRQENDKTLIAVTDNGKGIPAKYIDKVFDNFFRVPSGDLHDVKGYGLGLSYVKAVVGLHNGSISVKSTINEGSTFTIYLPATKTN